MPDVFERARAHFTTATHVPSDEEMDARYLGFYPTHADLAKALFQIDTPYETLTTWPYSHIDWDAAAAEVFAEDTAGALWELDGHWFDAKPDAPILPAT